MMMIGIVLLWAAIIGLAVWGFRWLFPSGIKPTLPKDAEQDALNILAARYARGEITREQYQRMRRDIAPLTEVEEPAGGHERHTQAHQGHEH
ncbi:MAG: SHOCT domain-containing protein [Chloroflexi bacterium]|nr:SHOCT domain-containing protein [Chloroflexota bacterium]